MTTTTAQSRDSRILLGAPVEGALSVGTRRLVAAGIAAGILFTGIGLLEFAIVPWFDITKQPLSVLSLGSLGWLQKSSFMLAGALVLLSAIGLRKALRRGPASVFGVGLIGAFGVGLIGAGIFDVDPTEGNPPGTAVTEFTGYSWHMYAHNLSSMLAFLAVTIACFVFIRRFLRARRPGWAIYSVLTGLSTFVGIFWPDPTGISLRLAICTVFMFAWLAAVCLLVRRESPRD